MIDAAGQDHVPYDKRPLVYVAGPYSQGDPVVNVRRAVQSATSLLDTGLVTPFVPHLTMLWHLIDERPLEFWYEYDMAVLCRCDALLRLDGPSTGADKELARAELEGIPVFTDSRALLEWASRRASG